MSKAKLQKVVDSFAISLSFICMVHCLLVPVAVSLLPVLSVGFFSEEIFHELMLWFVIPSSSIAFYMGWKHHHGPLFSILGASGLVLLVAAVSLGHDVLSPSMEVLMTTLGGLSLAGAHALNYRRCSTEESCSQHIDHSHSHKHSHA